MKIIPALVSIAVVIVFATLLIIIVPALSTSVLQSSDTPVTVTAAPLPVQPGMISWNIILFPFVLFGFIAVVYFIMKRM